MFSDLSSSPFGKIDYKMNYNLECTLQKQIEFIKKKYNWKNQATKLYNQLF